MELLPPADSERTEEWRAGYEAGYTTALTDAVGLIDSMHGHGRNSLVEPLLLRIRTRFLDLMTQRQRHAA